MPDWRELAATGLGLGYSPFAPGTAGSGGALALAWMVTAYGGAQGGYVLLAVAILRGAVACHCGMATFDEAAVSGRDPA